MGTFFATLSPMITLFLCIAIGFVLSRAKILSDGASKTLAKLETWVFCPSLSFMTMLRNCTPDLLATHATNFAMGSIMLCFATGIAIVLAGFFAKRKTPEWGVYAYALTFANFGYVSDPVVLAMFGDAVLAQYKFFALSLSVMCYVWGISVLTPAKEGRGAAFKRLLNPPTIAMLLGVVMGLCGVGGHMPSFLTSTLDSLKACMGPVGMILAGVTIARYDFWDMLKNKKVYLATALRLVVLPAVLIAILFAIKTLANGLLHMAIGNDVLFLAFFATAAPLGLNTIIFPEAYNGNPKTGASMAMISHTLCVISIPLLYALMVALFGTPFGG